MPRVRINRTAGARREVTYLGVSQRDGEQSNNRRAARARREKLALIREVERLIQPQEIDWKAAGERMSLLHRRWNAIPSAGRDQDERLYRRYRKAFDRYQTQRREHFAAVTRHHRRNAAIKEELIEQARGLSTLEDLRTGKRRFSELCSRWRAIGHAGRREQELWEQFMTAAGAIPDATPGKSARGAPRADGPRPT